MEACYLRLRLSIHLNFIIKISCKTSRWVSIDYRDMFGSVWYAWEASLSRRNWIHGSRQHLDRLIYSEATTKTIHWRIKCWIQNKENISSLEHSSTYLDARRWYVYSLCKEITQSAGHTCSAVSPRLTDNNASYVIERFCLEEHISDKDKRQDVDRAGTSFTLTQADMLSSQTHGTWPAHRKWDTRNEEDSWKDQTTMMGITRQVQ